MATLLLRKYSIHPRTPGTLKQDMMTDMRFYFPFIRSRPSQAMGLAFGASRLQDFCMSVCHLSRGDPCIVYRRCRCETNVLYIAPTGSWLTLVATVWSSIAPRAWLFGGASMIAVKDGTVRHSKFAHVL